jgi:hypothetical protein
MPENKIQKFEKLLGRLEQRPWSAVYRMLVGFLLLPVHSLCRQQKVSFIPMGLFFLVVLFTLRLVPAILRRSLPFSDETQTSWKRKRQLAKRYDSYQWSKLFWVGLGIAGYLCLLRREQTSRAEVSLAFLCLAAGGVGLAVWRNRTQTEEYLRTYPPS